MHQHVPHDFVIDGVNTHLILEGVETQCQRELSGAGPGVTPLETGRGVRANVEPRFEGLKGKTIPDEHLAALIEPHAYINAIHRYTSYMVSAGRQRAGRPATCLLVPGWRGRGPLGGSRGMSGDGAGDSGAERCRPFGRGTVPVDGGRLTLHTHRTVGHAVTGENLKRIALEDDLTSRVLDEHELAHERSVVLLGKADLDRTDLLHGNSLKGGRETPPSRARRLIFFGQETPQANEGGDIT
jgi:hypothetical protein